MLGRKTFFDVLFGRKPDDQYVCIWQSKSKLSFYSKEIPEILAYVEKHKAKDTYVGMGTSQTKLVSRQRYKAEHVNFVPGFWADVDIAGNGHKKKNLVETYEEATKIVKGVPWGEPTMIVKSGGGIHVYWVLAEPWVFVGPEANANAHAIMAQFGTVFKDRVKALHGYEVDSVWDLARVLRVPGTRNCKQEGCEVWAEVAECDPGRLYKIDAVIKLLGGQPQTFKAPKQSSLLPQVSGDLVFDERATPNQDRLEELCQIDPDFYACWKNMANFPSPSEYEMSMARRATRAGWKPQEIVNLMIAWRREHGHDLKKVIARPDYVKATIARAMQDDRAERTADREPVVVHTPVVNDETLRENLEYLSEKLGLIVNYVKKFKEDEHQFQIGTELGVINVGSVSGMTDQTRLRNRVFAETRHLIPRCKPKEWDNVVLVMGKVWEEVQVAEESTMKGRVRVAIVEMVENTGYYKDFNQSVMLKYACIYDGHWWINMETFYGSYSQLVDRKADRKDILRAFYNLGLEPGKVNYQRIDGTRTNQRYWRIPHSVVEPPKKNDKETKS